MRHVLVTGASSGIGLALCKLLVRDHGVHVYLGSRNTAKGDACLKGIVEEVPDAAGKIEVVTLDVTDPGSIKAAVESLKVMREAALGFVEQDAATSGWCLDQDDKGDYKDVGLFFHCDPAGQSGQEDAARPPRSAVPSQRTAPSGTGGGGP